MKRTFFALMILFLLSGCGSNSPTADVPALIPPSPEPSLSVPTESILQPVEETPSDVQATPVCVSSQPAQADIDRALSYAGKLFERLDWQRSYTVADGRVSVTWLSDSLAAVAFLEALIFPCGYEDLDLDSFFNVDNWQIVFGNYESYRMVSECRTDTGVRLYQFRTVEQGYEYDVRYWAVNDTDTRVMVVMLVFPIESPAVGEEYAYSLFPQLVQCK